MKLMVGLVGLLVLVGCALTTISYSASNNKPKWFQVEPGRISDNLPAIWINVVGIKVNGTKVSGQIKDEFLRPAPATFISSNDGKPIPGSALVKYFLQNVTIDCEVETMTEEKTEVYDNENKLIFTYIPKELVAVPIQPNSTPAEPTFRVFCKKDKVQEKFSI